MKPYPKYKDSGVEWLGEIPVGWSKFFSVFRVFRGLYFLTTKHTKITKGKP